MEGFDSDRTDARVRTGPILPGEGCRLRPSSGPSGSATRSADRLGTEAEPPRAGVGLFIPGGHGHLPQARVRHFFAPGPTGRPPPGPRAPRRAAIYPYSFTSHEA